MAVSKAVRGRDATIFVDGLNASPYLNEYEFESERDDIDVTPFGEDGKIYLAGPAENTVTLTGFWNGDTASLDERLDSTFGAGVDNVVTICPGGETASKAAYICTGTQVSYNVSAESDDLTEAEAEFRSERVRGRILKSSAVVSATGNGTPVVDTTALTTFGAVANLHVLAITGTPTSVNIDVAHSADGTTWADLITFTAVAGATGYRAETSKTTTVNVQLRAEHTITGGTTPTLSYVLVAGRRRS